MKSIIYFLLMLAALAITGILFPDDQIESDDDTIPFIDYDPQPDWR